MTACVDLFVEGLRIFIIIIIGHKKDIFHLACLSCDAWQINTDKMPDSLKNNSQD